MISSRHFGVGLLLIMAGTATANMKVPIEEVEATRKVTASFSNAVTGSALTAYSGQVSTPGDAPTDGTVRLQRSAMGQPIAAGIASPAIAESTLSRVRAMLYYQDAENSTEFSADEAAFRYKVLMYGTEEGDSRLRARFEEFTTWYDTPERQRALDAERLLREALVGDPLNIALQDAMLDLYADRAVAEVQFIKQRLESLNRLQLGFETHDSSTQQILAELELLNGTDGVLPRYRSILDTYGELLHDPYGVNVADLDPAHGNLRKFGHLFFTQRGPTRNALVPQYMTDQGTIEFIPVSGAAVTDYPVLYIGYRDPTLLLSIMADYAAALTEAARLYALLIDADNPDDPIRETALELIAEGQNRVYLDGRLLISAFPNIRSEATAASGFAAAADQWESALRRLGEVRQAVIGNRNPLGFQPDFLVLATGLQGQGGTFQDSYNALASWMTTLTDPPTRPLAVAVAEHDRARNLYESYRGYEDQVATQYNSLQSTFAARAFELVGTTPDNPDYNPGNPATGKIAEQILSIKLAQSRIDENQQLIDNAEESIEIEIARRAEEADINSSINDIYIEYGDKRADLREEIGKWKSGQAAAQGINGMLNSAFSAASLGPKAVVASVIFGAINTGIQAGGESSIAEDEADLERKAALEQAAINTERDNLLDNNSKAVIANLTLQLATLSIQSQQTALVLQQESIRLGQLYAELAEIERVYDSNAEFLSERYYADPIHYLRTQSSMQRAKETFREAQDWTFFAARALEYKWNTEFSRTVGARTWSVDELFRTRHSRELSEMMAAMELYDGAQSLGPGTGTNTDSISLREDILGYRDLDSEGEPIFYSDPETGLPVRAIEAFRSYLSKHIIERSNGNRDLIVSFSTAFSPSGSQFYLPPQFDEFGNPTSLGTWLNKVQWFKINVPGNHTRSGFVNGFLSDGGTQFIRNREVGSFDPARPDAVVGDLTAYTSRIYFTADGGQSFEFRDRLRVPIRMELDFPAGTTTMPDVPENTFFRERSVANTQWTLEVTTFDASGAPGGLNLLRLHEIDDIELVVNHRFSPRL